MAAGAAFGFGAGDSAAGCSLSLFDPNRLPKKLPIPPPLDAEATWTDERGAAAGFDSLDARLMVLPVVVSGCGAPGGLTCAGMVPTAVRIFAPPPPCDFTAARKVGFMPPSVPVLTGAGGAPRLISSAVCISSRRCLSRTAATRSAGTL